MTFGGVELPSEELARLGRTRIGDLDILKVFKIKKGCDDSHFGYDKDMFRRRKG
jgi:hypothetical protein